MAIAFAAGSTCFLLGPFPGYLALVGPVVDGVTFFVGSLLFTAGGARQVWLAVPARREPGAGRAAWWTATVQLAGTLFLNVTTFRGLHTALSNASYDRLVWRPDAFGSVCSSSRVWWRTTPRPAGAGCRCGVRTAGGSRASTCWAACSSAWRRSPGTSSPRRARCWTWPRRTGPQQPARRASWPAR